MRYEPLYGLQKPFDNGPADSTAYGLFRDGDEYIYYKIDKTSVYCFDTDNQWSHIDGAPTIPFLAMRRIIPEPKRWTVEDQKAGRLPEVGCIVEYFNNNEHDDTEVTAQWRNGDELEILRHQNKNKAFVVFNARTERSSDLIVQCMKQIETPEEKAQREEDEFVFLVESEYNKMPNEISFKDGIRAAYRKLKGGER